MQSFWEKLAVPFTVLAPMEGVTDVVFRQILTKIGKPDVFVTEFTSCDGLMSNGREKVGESLKFFRNEQPIVAQIWGIHPETFYKAAEYCSDLGFSGIDINMGCPVRVVIKDGACGGLIKNPKLAKEIITATKEGAQGLPVSVKTRIGFGKPEITEWIGFLLKQNVAALTVHLRTVDEQSKVPGHWEFMEEIVAMRNKISPKTKLIGNGDIMTLSEVQTKFKKYNCEGFMIGRGIFTNPWMFNKKMKVEETSIQNRLELFVRHIKLFDTTWKGKKNPANLKKFAKTYIHNFPGAGGLRDTIMELRTTEEMIAILESFGRFDERARV